MNNIEKHHQEINKFESHYQYDSSYMRELLKSSAAGYQLFADFLPLAHYREHLSVEDFWVAKIAVMQVADCGACLQLNIKMAKEQGVTGSLISNVLNDDHSLPDHLKQLKKYAQQIAVPTGVDDELMQIMRERYNQGQLLEFGLCAASATVFPMIKRAIGSVQSCSITNVEEL